MGRQFLFVHLLIKRLSKPRRANNQIWIWVTPAGAENFA
jgi:hypothetical protein